MIGKLLQTVRSFYFILLSVFCSTADLRRSFTTRVIFSSLTVCLVALNPSRKLFCNSHLSPLRLRVRPFPPSTLGTHPMRIVIPIIKDRELSRTRSLLNPLTPHGVRTTSGDLRIYVPRSVGGINTLDHNPTGTPRLSLSTNLSHLEPSKAYDFSRPSHISICS